MVVLPFLSFSGRDDDDKLINEQHKKGRKVYLLHSSRNHSFGVLQRVRQSQVNVPHHQQAFKRGFLVCVKFFCITHFQAATLKGKLPQPPHICPKPAHHFTSVTAAEATIATSLSLFTSHPNRSNRTARSSIEDRC